MSLPGAPPVYYPKASISAIEYRWDPPANNNDDPAILYELTVSPGSNYTINSPFTRFSFPVPTAYEVYSATVRASNSTGWGPTSSFRDIHAADKPGGPSNILVTQETTSIVQVVWDIASSNGGAPIQWQVLKLLHVPTQTILQKLPSYSNDTFKYITGLNNTSTFQVLVQSVNDVGYSSSSTISPIFAVFPQPRVQFEASNYTNGSSNWSDLSPNGFDATLAGGTGQLNAQSNGILLDGSTFWRFPPIGPLNGIYTIAFWFKNLGGAYSGFSPTIVTTELTTSDRLEFLVTANIFFIPGWTAGFYYNGSFYLGTRFDLSENNWAHYAFTLDGSNITTYINGVSIGSVGYGNEGSNFYSGESNLIGKRWDANEFVYGEIGNLRIYDTALSSDFIQLLYSSQSNIFSNA